MAGTDGEALTQSPVEQLVAETNYYIEGSQELVRTLVEGAVEHTKTILDIDNRNYYPVPGDYDSSHQRAYSKGCLEYCFKALDSLGWVDEGWAAKVVEVASPKDKK